MVAPLPSHITIVEAESDGKTIRELAISVNVAYLTPYYQVKRKENISVAWEGCISKTAKVVLKPTDIPAGAEVFVQTTSHNRKIPIGMKCLLQTAVADTAALPAAAPAPSPTRPRHDNDDDDETDPSPVAKRARVDDDEKKVEERTRKRRNQRRLQQ